MQSNLNFYLEGFERVFERLNSNDPYYSEVRDLQYELEDLLGKSALVENYQPQLARLLDQVNVICENRLGIAFFQLCSSNELETNTVYEDIQKTYLNKLESRLSQWSAKVTNLRITTNIRVASYRGQRLKKEMQKNDKWWFGDALSESDDIGMPIRPRVVILGDPGAGKTTLCQKYVMELARGWLKVSKDEKIRMPIPIFLELNTYRSDAAILRGLKPYQRFLALISESINILIADTTHKPIIDQYQLEEWMGMSPFTFLFDGLNEVGAQNKLQLLDDLNDFINVFGGQNHQFVVTTRKFDYEYELASYFPDNKYDALEILELDGEGVDEFILRDLGSIEDAFMMLPAFPEDIQADVKEILEKIKVGNNLDQGIQAFTEHTQKLPTKLKKEGIALVDKFQLARNLIDLIRDPEYDRVLWLAQNPATLKDIIDVYRMKKSIPKSRVKLFEQAIQARIHAQAKKGDSQFPDELKFSALQRLAFRMSDPKEGLSLSENTVLEIFSGALMEFDMEGKDSSVLLHEIVFHDGLLIERVKREYSFIKQPYQEYFVARELRDCWRDAINNKKNPLVVEKIKHFFSDSSFFQMTSGIAGLLSPAEVGNLLKYLRKRKSTQRLAALCVRNSEVVHSKDVSDFVNWSRKKVLGFSLLPDKLFNLILITLYPLAYLTLLIAGLLPHKNLVSLLPVFLKRIIPSAYLYLPQIVSGVIIFSALILWVSMRIYARKSLNAFDGILSLFIIFVAVFSGIGYFGSRTETLMLWIGTFSFLALLQRCFSILIIPMADVLNARLEEYIVHTRLINYLEIMRDIGPEASTAIMSIQQELSMNNYVSDRVKDAINRTWAQSPKTALQVLENPGNTPKQIEAVTVLSPVILQYNVEPSIREKAVALLFQIIAKREDKAAILGALDTLRDLGIQNIDYRDKIVSILKEVLKDKKYSLHERRKSWRVLTDLGVSEKYPKDPIIRNPVFIFIFIVLIVLLSILIFVIR